MVAMTMVRTIGTYTTAIQRNQTLDLYVNQTLMLLLLFLTMRAVMLFLIMRAVMLFLTMRAVMLFLTMRAIHTSIISTDTLVLTNWQN